MAALVGCWRAPPPPRTQPDPALPGLLALVGIDGDLVTVRVADGDPQPHRLRIPSCEGDGYAELERGGKRAVAYYLGDVIVWNRMTGSRLGAARFPSAVAEVIPVKDRDEVVVVEGRNLNLWSLRTGELRTPVLPSDHTAALSPDARRLAIGFASGQIALFDVDAMRAALPISRAAPLKVANHCEARDPFTPDPTPEPEMPFDDSP